MCDRFRRLCPVTVVIVIACSVLQGCLGDLCLDGGGADVADHVHQQSTPKGGPQAGTFTKDGKADSLEKCLLSCCESLTCGAIFYHTDICFLIECNVTVPDACDAEARNEQKYQDTFLVNVRTLDEVATAKAKSVDDSQGGPLIKTECDPEVEGTCASHEKCEVEINKDLIGSVCVCEEDYIRDPISHNCIRIVGTNDEGKRKKDLSCEYPLPDDCTVHEECVAASSRSRMGLCECLENYRRNSESGWCEKSEDKVDVKEVASSSTSSSSSTTLSTTMNMVKKASTTTPLPRVEPLVVSVGDDKVLILPDNQVNLDAYTLPKDTKDEYQYQWSLTSHPVGDQVGDMKGINTNKLKLSNLIQGLYTFKIAVSADGKYGEAFVNVTVQPPQRINEMPVAIVKPTFQKVNQPNNVVLDGSESTDDDKIIKYRWEQASGPVNTQQIDESDLEKPMLNLNGLNAGEYRFKLTVTDSDNAQNSTFANVTVIKETDYPPKANAGPNMIINLPQNSVKLYGNASTDDKGIESYEWIKKSQDKLTADMTGVRTPVLLLEHLELGDYTFSLKVTDEAEQTSTADVSVFVREEHNKPPSAHAGKDRSLWMPMDHTSLDGSNSTDDQKVTEYKWTQVSGPTTTNIEDSDKVIARVANLKIGEYKFKLTVKDKDGLESSSTTSINVMENQNRPPEAHAGGSQVVTLPTPLVVLDGSQSSDDKAIATYLWSREDKSLAAGEIVNKSDHKAILQLANLVAGPYWFTLQVTDKEGLSDKETVSVVVRPEENRDDLIEMEVETNIGQFTVSDQRNLEQQLALLLHTSSAFGDTDVDIQHLEIEKKTGNLIVTFKVMTVTKESNHVWEGPEVKEILTKKLRANKDVLDFSVVHLDTVVCQNNCSDHGQCDQNSKLCMCEAFWMENFLKAYVIEQSNCDWSVLYVIIIAMIAVISVAAVVWGCICLCRRWNRFRPKKRHRYTLLAEIDNDKDDTEMLPKGKLQSSSLMVSESDFSSDEETLFINKKANGHVKNGLIKSGKNKVRT